ncbi:Heparan sulfate 2-O-sulfotransferase 1 [Eufriesea mexicana]|uniref:uronyl 2-sulfotransferase-like n=1 Tax=Eufriesea mexicana TaxID=516756 RepID=UPI00083C8E2D|nr:PREDICTED: uronyl 2-sulfotransferase-like [Eufriesea mexicana]OAD60956.1 Heparan sulfate 2-O-sulfotransferase 1 [Eufriesea mexicana]
MRLSRSLVTSVVVCLTVFFIVLNSKSAVEMTNDSGSSIEKPYVGEMGINKGQTYRYVTPSLAELGARGSFPKMNKHILMLTRVPDAGAELLVLMLQRLQGYNAFKHVRLPPGDHRLLSTLQEELLVEEITNIIRQEAIPLSFDGDVRFLNFSKFGRESPSFISLVRNPIGAQNLQRYRGRRKNMFEGRAIPTFCGQDSRCTEINNKWALQRAKANIVEWYPVVGILDYMEQSMDVLEYKFPYFFRGAKHIYKKIRPTEKRFIDSAIVLNSRERDILFKLFETEIEFYQWLKFRLLNETSSIDSDESYYS